MEASSDWEFTFGERLRKARRRAGISQQTVADALGVKVNRYSNWEVDTASPRGHDLVRVASVVEKLTGAPLDWILGIRTGSEWWAPETSLHLLTPSEPFEDDDTRLHAERFGYQPAR